MGVVVAIFYMSQFFNCFNRVTSVAALVVLCLTHAPRLAADTAINAVFAPGEEINNIVGARYKFELRQNESPFIIIVFGWNRLNGESAETYLIENNVYADGLTYPNGVCTTWPLLGQYLPATGSLRSAVPDYNRHGWVGARTLSPGMFPRQSYLIDGIDGLWKTDMISQANLNNVECAVEIQRGGMVTNRNDWKCSGLLDTNVVFREWSVVNSFAGANYTNLYAFPETNARFITPHEVLGFGSEFLWREQKFKLLLWDLELLRENEVHWRSVNRWRVTRQDAAPVAYGTRVTKDSGRQVIEMSNDGPGNFLPKDAVFDLAVVPEGEVAPDLAPVAFTAPYVASPGETIPVVLTVTNRGTGASPSFQLGYYLSDDGNIAWNDPLAGPEWIRVNGLLPNEAITLTNLVTIPANAPGGTHHLGASVDHRGVIGELNKTNNTIASPLRVLRCLPSSGDTVTNVWSLHSGFVTDAWLREEVSDNRDVGGSATVTSLIDAGALALVNGTITNQGPTFTAPGFIPYVMLDTNRQWVVLHPGPGSAASVGFVACRTATYRVTGTFARANSFQFAGDGVRVAIARNTEVSNLLFSATIPSSADVDPARLFVGPGSRTFDLTLTLTSRETLRFLVFNGEAGNDPSFDATALELTVMQYPPAPLSIEPRQVGGRLQLAWPSVPGTSYEVQSSADLLEWSAAAFFFNVQTNRMIWTPSSTGEFNAFRLRLNP